MVELVDTQDLKSCALNRRAGSIPAPSTKRSKYGALFFHPFLSLYNRLMFKTYILQSLKSGRYYIGHTSDFCKRLARHNAGNVTATRNKGPWILVHIEEFSTRKDANNRELEIKSKKSRKYIKQLLVNNGTGRHVPT